MRHNIEYLLKTLYIIHFYLKTHASRRALDFMCIFAWQDFQKKAVLDTRGELAIYLSQKIKSIKTINFAGLLAGRTLLGLGTPYWRDRYRIFGRAWNGSGVEFMTGASCGCLECAQSGQVQILASPVTRACEREGGYSGSFGGQAVGFLGKMW